MAGFSCSGIVGSVGYSHIVIYFMTITYMSINHLDHVSLFKSCLALNRVPYKPIIVLGCLDMDDFFES